MKYPSPQKTQAVPVPAATGGINALANLMDMSPQDCVMSINYIPQTYGMEIRRGYQKVGYGFSGVSDGMRTIISYEGSTASKNKLFVATKEGIYDCSAEATSYTTEIAWATKTGNAGYCTFTVYTTIAEKFILLCDEVNGYYLYTESTDSWARIAQGGSAGQITDTNGASGGTNPNDFRHVTVWKQRVWFVLKDSGTAFYLPAGQVTGTVTPFYFGNKFLTGGFLHSIHNFTMDGGVGPDDYLAALSSAGDVVAYQGTDPATIDTFNIVGVWNIGHLPTGRNITANSGGDLYILCANGLASLTQIVKGADPGTLPAYITGKITPLIREDIAARSSSRGWNVTNFSGDGLLIITVPYSGSSNSLYQQYVMNTTTRAWTKFLGLPAHCAAEWLGSLYLGGTSALYKYTGAQDDVAYQGTAGVPINAFQLTAFSGKGVNTRIQFIRPQFIGRGIPLYEAEARYDFDIASTVATLSGALPPAGGSTWADDWGVAYWGENAKAPFAETKGAFGLGKFAGIALTTRSQLPATLIGFTAMIDTGGIL